MIAIIILKSRSDFYRENRVPAEPGLVMGKTDDDLIVLPADACLCPALDLQILVVRVMQLTGGCHLLFPDGSLEQVFCASRDAVDAGGFWWGADARQIGAEWGEPSRSDR